MIDRLDLLLMEVRRATKNLLDHVEGATGSTAIGLQTNELVHLANEAQRIIQSELFRVGQGLFLSSTTINTVADQELYDMPSDAFMGAQTQQLEYLCGNRYEKLLPKHLFNRDSYTKGIPCHYIRLGNQIGLNPVPSSSVAAGLRVIYTKAVRDIDVRRGQILSITGTSTVPLALVLTEDSGGEGLGDVLFTELSQAAYGDMKGFFVTVVDANGVQQMKAMPITSWNSSTQTLTLDTFTAENGESIAASDYVVFGKNASTHSELDNLVRPLIVQYIVAEVLRSRGNISEFSAANQKFQAMLISIRSSYTDMSSDIIPIPGVDIEW